MEGGGRRRRIGGEGGGLPKDGMNHVQILNESGQDMLP